jgi:hypothetical protein
MLKTKNEPVENVCVRPLLISEAFYGGENLDAEGIGNMFLRNMFDDSENIDYMLAILPFSALQVLSLFCH